MERLALVIPPPPPDPSMIFFPGHHYIQVDYDFTHIRLLDGQVVFLLILDRPIKEQGQNIDAMKKVKTTIMIIIELTTNTLV